MSLAELRVRLRQPIVPSADELIGRARALAPKLRERAVQGRARPQHSARVG